MKTNTISNRARAALAAAGYAIQDNPAIVALTAYAAQNPGLEPRNYFDPYDLAAGRRETYRQGRAAYASEGRAISAEWRRFKAALIEAGAEGVTDAAVIAAAPHCFAGRLGFVATCRLWAASQTCKVLRAETLNGRAGYIISGKEGHESHQTADNLTIAIDYCTGQYWPTEYRKAAATVLEHATREVRASRPPVARMPTTIAELRALNKANGSCWFEPGTMRFFGTRIESGIIRGRYFITSEQPPHGPRGFTVRSFDSTADIETIGELCGHATKADALAAIPREEPAHASA